MHFYTFSLISSLLFSSARGHQVPCMLGRSMLGKVICSLIDKTGIVTIFLLVCQDNIRLIFIMATKVGIFPQEICILIPPILFKGEL